MLNFLLFFPSVIITILWYLCIIIGMRQNDEKDRVFHGKVYEAFEIDLRKYSYVGTLYWKLQDNSEIIWDLVEVYCSLTCIAIIITCTLICIFCAFSIYFEVFQKSRSEQVQRMEKQILSALIFQTLAPFLLMYTPIGLVLSLPMFDIHLGSLASIVSATTSIYPMFEPIHVLLYIKMKLILLILLSTVCIVFSIPPCWNQHCPHHQQCRRNQCYPRKTCGFGLDAGCGYQQVCNNYYCYDLEEIQLG
ncbi:unnamed protein product [Caenorhabditis angaria]|uniref:Seven TM Receptor n=1 Tax=Caenorhabditis angaria TaxID=860376 RepID=A0A9P1IXR9_9PELO|nr:unnamed protein product [Caenorhabditis angaria]